MRIVVHASLLQVKQLLRHLREFSSHGHIFALDAVHKHLAGFDTLNLDGVTSLDDWLQLAAILEKLTNQAFQWVFDVDVHFIHDGLVLVCFGALRHVDVADVRPQLVEDLLSSDQRLVVHSVFCGWASSLLLILALKFGSFRLFLQVTLVSILSVKGLQVFQVDRGAGAVNQFTFKPGDKLVCKCDVRISGAQQFVSKGLNIVQKVFRVNLQQISEEVVLLLTHVINDKLIAGVIHVQLLQLVVLRVELVSAVLGLLGLSEKVLRLDWRHLRAKLLPLSFQENFTRNI